MTFWIVMTCEHMLSWCDATRSELRILCACAQRNYDCMRSVQSTEAIKCICNTMSHIAKICEDFASIHKWKPPMANINIVPKKRERDRGTCKKTHAQAHHELENGKNDHSRRIDISCAYSTSENVPRLLSATYMSNLRETVGRCISNWRRSNVLTYREYRWQ